MSSKSSRDLLVRVRFQNPIPPPPFPPKLFNVPTDIHRLGAPEYLAHLSSSTPLPMLVDSEMGMPLDLNAYTGVWSNDEVLNPSIDPGQVHDPIDVILLAPIKPSVATNGDERPATVAEVSWMRNSSLFTRKTGSKKKEAKDTTEGPSVVDASEGAQIMSIDKTFSDLSEPAQHPEKPNLTVVETYDILPDVETWGNKYVMLKLPERPATGSVSRLSSAILRPVLDEDQQLMEYLLPQEADLERLEESYSNPADPDSVAQMQELGQIDGSDPKIDEVFTNVHYDRIRTYEVVSQEQPRKDFLIVLEEESNPRKRRRGAYYQELSMRSTLRKTRSTVENSESWDKTRIGYRQPRGDEVPSTEQVSDPGWVNEYLRKQHGTNDAEGLGEAIDEDEENE